MLKAIGCGYLLSIILAGAASAATCPTNPYTLTNGATADASQVMANFNSILTCANGSLVASSGGTLTGGTLSGTTALPGSGTITSSGSIGVGTATPSAVLQVAGPTSSPNNGLYVTTNTWSTSAGSAVRIGMGATSGNTYGVIDVLQNGWSTANGNLAINPQGGFVGIGTTSPTAPLTIISNVFPTEVISGTNASAISLQIINNQYSAGNSWNIANDSLGGLTLSHNGSDQFSIGRSGSSTANFTGTAYSPSFVSTSDERLKENIKTLDIDGLTIVEKLRPVSFTWKKPPSEDLRGQQLGLIAQEVQKIVPSAVVADNDKEKTLGINYAQITPLLVAAIKEQQVEIEELKAQVATLKASR